jgi:hypothetical protein
LEALQEFTNDVEEEKSSTKASLDIRTEAWVFGSEREEIKKLGGELTEKERVQIYKRLGNCDGESTKDFLALEQILQNLTPEEQEKIEQGRLKKIVLVMTDGESDDVSRVQGVSKALREKGVVVVGIGITDGGASVLETYAPEARVVSKQSDLPQVLAELLKEHLANL